MAPLALTVMVALLAVWGGPRSAHAQETESAPVAGSGPTSAPLDGLVTVPSPVEASGPSPFEGSGPALGGGPGGAPAVPESARLVEARDRLARGKRLFEAGDFAAARGEFLRCYALLEGHPQRHRVLFNIAQTQQWEYDYVAAIATYRRYLAEGGAAENERERVDATITLLTSLLAHVDLRVSPASAELWVDGQRRAVGSARLPLPAGRHLVEAQAPGFEGARRDVTLAAGESTRLAFTLRPVERRIARLRPSYFWAATALSGGLLIGGGTLGLVTLDRREELDRRLADPVARWNVSEAERDGVRSSARKADALLISGAAVAVCAVVLGLLTDWERP